MKSLVTQKSPSALPLMNRVEYDPVIKRFNVFLAGRPANEETVREFFTLEATVYSARSIQLHKCAIKAAVKQAMPSHDTRFIASMDSLFKSIKTPKPDGKVQEVDLFTKKEIRAVIKEAPRHIGLFIQVMYDTGSRVSECLSMRVKDCIEDRDAVRCKITGKGSRERTLTMTKTLFRQVRKHFAGKVWLFEHAGKRYGRQHIWSAMSVIGRKVTGRRLHPHSMRHSRITHLLDDGHPLAAVSRFAGHAQVTTTVQFYAHNLLDARTITGSAL